MKKMLLWMAVMLPLAVLGQEEGSLRIVFCGDLMGHGGQIKAAAVEEGGYDYSPCFKFIEGYWKGADLTVANFELTLAGPPYRGYPQFSSPDQVLIDAHKAGIGLFTTVNNHCMDSGKKGFLRTLDVFDSLGIPHLGTYRNEMERLEKHPLLMEKNGIRLAFVTYTYGTNGLPVVEPLVANLIDTLQMASDIGEARRQGAEYVIAMVHWGIEYQTKANKEQEPLVANLIDTLQMASDIGEARRQGAEYVIAMVHWGIEYQTKANKEQETLAKYLLEKGADIVIGGHPHVVQNATMDARPENKKEPEIVVYSMGNLVSNQRDVNTDGGIMIELQLKKDEKGKIEQDCWYMPYWVYRGEYDGLYQYYILPSYDATKNPEKYQLEAKDLKALTVFDENTYLRLKGQLKECSYRKGEGDTINYELSR